MGSRDLRLTDVVIGHFGTLTLKGQHLSGLVHDAELQNQLGGALQEGLKQTEHADIGALKHHAPVVVPALGVPVPAALHTQIQGVDVPVYQRQTQFKHIDLCIEAGF